MKVHFIGSPKELKMLENKMQGMLRFVDYKESEIVLIEINSTEALNELPKTFLKPTFFYITTEDPNLLRYIGEYNIKGTIYSFFNKPLILKRLDIVKEDKSDNNKREKTPVSLERIYAKANNIPALPTIAQEIITLSADDNISMNKIINKIKMEQGMTSALLRLVNSPFYGLRKEITSIEHAAVLLGLNNISKLAFAVSFKVFYTKNFSLYNTNGVRLWMHSFNVARLCECISKPIAGIDRDAIFLAGLMHDVGKVILVDFLYKVTTSPADEEKQTGTNHMDVGAIVLEKWHVGANIVKAVKSHHSVTNSIFNLVLYYADIIERMPKVENYVIEEMGDKLKMDKERLSKEIEGATSKFSQTI